MKKKMFFCLNCRTFALLISDMVHTEYSCQTPVVVELNSSDYGRMCNGCDDPVANDRECCPACGPANAKHQLVTVYEYPKELRRS